MGKLAKEFIEQVRQAADIVSVVSEYVNLKRSGSNFQSLCPFHAEKTPSFSVSPRHQIFKCFGCGKAGNVISFVMEITGLNFPEAVTHLANKCGIPIPVSSFESEGEQRHRHDLLELMEWSARFFQEELRGTQGQKGREYLQKRKLSGEIIERFRLGFAQPGYENFMREALKQGLSHDLLEQSGLIVKSQKCEKYYDRFRNRVIFPIYDVEGRVIAFGGRVISPEDEPKYLNSPETSLFSKRKTLYALNFARSQIKKSADIIVMEGYTDAIMAHQYDFTQAVATLGTSLTEDHTRLIHRYTDSVKLVYDGDAAGQSAMMKSFHHFLNQGIHLKLVVLPQKSDPCDLLLEKGGEYFQSCLENARDILDFQIQQISSHYDLQSTGGKRMAIAEFKKTIAIIPDRVTQRLFLVKMGEFFKIPPEVLEKEILTEKSQQVASFQIETCRKSLQRHDEEFLLWAGLHFPEKMAEISSHYKPEDYESPGLAELARAIAIRSASIPDIAGLSLELDPSLGQRLVDIYYNSAEENISREEVESRLYFVFKAISRKRHRTNLATLRSMLASAAEDDDDRIKILQEAQNLCRNRVKGNS